jgi:5-methylcytosine-specific restriction endonuclease McrA
MLSYSRAHLADHVLLRTLTAFVTQDRATTAELLALIGEVDERGLFRDEGYPSMYKFCVEKLRMAEDVACKRILAARVARRFPLIIPAIEDGRLTLTAIVLLRPHITAENGEELLATAVGMTKPQIELLIAERFPRADVATTLTPVWSIEAPRAPQASSAISQLAAGAPKTEGELLAPPTSAPQTVTTSTSVSAPERVAPERGLPIANQAVPAAPQHRVAPLSPGRFELRLTISRELRDKLQRAQELLGHSVPSGDIAQIFERALDELIAKQEKVQLARTDKPRPQRRSRNPRHIPASVKRAVQKRDDGQCTYISGDGHRCQARRLLQYDHVVPVARGGTSTVDNVRLRCGPHNQLEAERFYGAGFMEEMRRREDTGPAVH